MRLLKYVFLEGALRKAHLLIVVLAGLIACKMSLGQDVRQAGVAPCPRSIVSIINDLPSKPEGSQGWTQYRCDEANRQLKRNRGSRINTRGNVQKSWPGQENRHVLILLAQGNERLKIRNLVSITNYGERERGALRDQELMAYSGVITGIRLIPAEEGYCTVEVNLIDISPPVLLPENADIALAALGAVALALFVSRHKIRRLFRRRVNLSRWKSGRTIAA